MIEIGIVFLSMNMDYLSIYLVLWCLSSEFCSFSRLDLIYILLDLHLSISFFSWAIVSHVVLLSLEYMCPLPVYRNMIDMCIFILHPATLLSTHSGRFSCRFLGIFYLDNLLTFTNRHSFISSFLIPYLLLPFLIAVARTSNTVLNKSENGLSCS